MDSLFHFALPLIASLAARIHVRHGIFTVIGLALASLLIDLDHVWGVPRATFHNLFITLLIPIIFIILAWKYEKKGNYFKTVSIILLLFLSSHVIADMFTEGGVQLFYPLSPETYNFDVSWKVAMPNGTESYLVSSYGVGMFVYLAIILLVLFLEDLLPEMKKQKSFKKGITKTLKKEERKIKRSL